MNRFDCATRIPRPRITAPAYEPTREERRVATDLAAELAGIVLRASAEGEALERRCGLVRGAGERLQAMSATGRRRALAAAKGLAAGREGGVPGDGISPELGSRIRNLARARMEAVRPRMLEATREVVDRVRGMARLLPRTRVRVRPTAEVYVSPRRSYCSDMPPKVTFEWETDEPGAGRAYWELRGPVGVGDPGSFLARGFVENVFDEGRVGGSFTLDMADYMPPGTPDPTREYHLRVLPLATPAAGPSIGRHTGHSLVVLADHEPAPPAGVGAWSAPAIVLVGVDCRSPGTVFDFKEIDYYRKARVQVDWFRVDADQPGPGDEEYHLRAFVVKHTPVVGSTPLGTFGAFLQVAEGDESRHTLNWKSYVHDLDAPVSPRWPQSFTVALSVLEEDAGDELDEWEEAMADLARAALEGEVAAEIQAFLNDLADELAEASEELKESLKEEFLAYVGAIIGAAAASAVAAIVAFAAGIIQAFARAGALDDHYGIEVLVFTLATNDAQYVNDGSALTVDATRVLAANRLDEGTEEAGRYRTGPVVIQLLSRDSPDGAGLDGIVSFGLSLEFYDEVRGVW
ncbi:MAG: hypothetical protein PVI57_07765 [Gemmatimonadota bacterium]|jgi:hypothetical protein